MCLMGRGQQLFLWGGVDTLFVGRDCHLFPHHGFKIT